MATITSNMSLTTPETGDSDYASSVSDSFDNIDAHDHSTGKGVQIPTGGIADSAVTAAKIAAGTITANKLASGAVDGSTIENTGSVIRVKDAGITRAKLSALGQQVQDVATAFITSTSQTDFSTPISVSLTTTGRPVFIALIPDPAAIGGSPVPASSLFSGTNGRLFIQRDGTNIFALDLGTSLFPMFVDVAAAAGAHTYKLQGKVSAGTMSLTYGRFIAFEL
jgi:hypothetical protein